MARPGPTSLVDQQKIQTHVPSFQQLKGRQQVGAFWNAAVNSDALSRVPTCLRPSSNIRSSHGPQEVAGCEVFFEIMGL